MAEVDDTESAIELGALGTLVEDPFTSPGPHYVAHGALEVELLHGERRAIAELDLTGVTASSVELRGRLSPSGSWVAPKNQACAWSPAHSWDELPTFHGGGTNLDQESWIGLPFEVAHTQRTRRIRLLIGATGTKGTGFAAIVPLPEDNDIPVAPEELADVALGTALFELPELPTLGTSSQSVAIAPLSVDLPPGRYGVVVGTDAFGAELERGWFHVVASGGSCSAFGFPYNGRTPFRRSSVSDVGWSTGGSWPYISVEAAPLRRSRLVAYAADGSVELSDWGTSGTVLGEVASSGAPVTFAFDVSELVATLGSSHIGVRFEAVDAQPKVVLENVRLQVRATPPPGATTNFGEAVTLGGGSGGDGAGGASVTGYGTFEHLSFGGEGFVGEEGWGHGGGCTDDAPVWNPARGACEPACGDATPAFNPATGSCEACPEGKVFDAGLRVCVGGCDGEETRPGNNAPFTEAFDVGSATGTFTLTYQTYTQEDRVRVLQGGEEIFDSGCLGTKGNRTKEVPLNGSSNTVVVKVEPNCADPGSTAWVFTVACSEGGGGSGSGGGGGGPGDDPPEEPGRQGWALVGSGISAQAGDWGNENVAIGDWWYDGATSTSCSNVDVAGGALRLSQCTSAESGGGYRIDYAITNPTTATTAPLDFVWAVKPQGKRDLCVEAGSGASMASYAGDAAPSESPGSALVSGSGCASDETQNTRTTYHLRGLVPGETAAIESIRVQPGGDGDGGTLSFDDDEVVVSASDDVVYYEYVIACDDEITECMLIPGLYAQTSDLSLPGFRLGWETLVALKAAGDWLGYQLNADNPETMAASLQNLARRSANALADVVAVAQSTAAERDGCYDRVFVPHHGTDWVVRCRTEAGAEACTSKRHQPCAGAHTNGTWVYRIPNGRGGCRDRESSGVACHGTFCPTGSASSLPTCGNSTTCGPAGNQTTGIWCGTRPCPLSVEPVPYVHVPDGVPPPGC